MHGGYSEVYIDCIKMLLITSAIQIQFMREKYNLPSSPCIWFYTSFLKKKKRRRRLLQCALANATPYSMHSISSKIILFKVDVWCVSGIMKNQMAPRLLFFLPFSSQNLLWLTIIVLFLLDISVCWHVQGSVSQMFIGHVYSTIVIELSQKINTTTWFCLYRPAHQ